MIYRVVNAERMSQVEELWDYKNTMQHWLHLRPTY